ncbi:hypothetical protein PI126_g4401 [Phytophthora idaei]|nr:hypothetical protein PI126_g4401 [Phytophthora idaei]
MLELLVGLDPALILNNFGILRHRINITGGPINVKHFMIDPNKSY